MNDDPTADAKLSRSLPPVGVLRAPGYAVPRNASTVGSFVTSQKTVIADPTTPPTTIGTSRATTCANGMPTRSRPTTAPNAKNSTTSTDGTMKGT
ncbi:hypothetical protein QFZ26_002979 [Agromyces ramosus]|uniref:Uncharacterized protein n=1 Tax=Agromyces ramosus TaxID=33879 RepID=A0ABU0RBG8_9MICO|nr:hypothetical protein [Agromyces ramosus]MDQ0895424.1 hypothetical protein [Agromyces ramosus]